MGQFFTDHWNDILALNSSQWQIIAVLSVTVGTALFLLFNWLYSQRFKAQSDVIGLQKLQPITSSKAGGLIGNRQRRF